MNIKEQNKLKLEKLWNHKKKKNYNELKDFPQVRNTEVQNKIDETKKWEENIKQKKLKTKKNKCRYYFRQFETIRSFGDSIHTSKVK